MPFLLEIPLANGETVLVDVTGQVEGVVPVGRGRDVVGRLPEAFSTGLDRMQAFADEVLVRMRDTVQPPDVLAVEFGLKMSAKAGVVIAESTADAHIKVIAEWHRDSSRRRARREEDDAEEAENAG
ncbi:CU044_2847 family protein [Actinocorallia libanotica]|uniref:Trypsin-co-occurring domain-containing protein n=1 Tax=Actinocorallia libanotica TaxID=46162 RepID=A0ABP4CG72_9ACTN